MTYQVRVLPAQRSFDAQPTESILDAALRAGITLPHGCRDGACGACKGRVLAGQVEHGPHQASALSEAEAAQGLALFCCAFARTDLEIECRQVVAAGAFPVRKMPARIAAIERLGDDVAVLQLQLPANEKFEYHAGQYIDVILRDGTRRSYSMGSAPHLAERVELHIRHLPGGKFTDALFGVTQPALKERDIVRIEGPHGSFFLREDAQQPVVLLASGTGFAPIKAMIEHAISIRFAKPMVLYWGARARKDLYMDARAEQLVAQAREAGVDLRYVPVLSEPRPDDAWTGRTGFVHRAVMADLPDLSGWQVYACGVPVMIDAARADFVARCKLDPDAFFADAFVSEADKAQA